ncbi:MAG: mechanosensitive ion channel family protein [Rhizobiaceae bacterium]|nr:mechanosensitive ion channel family protein [Rhizobiaceae bacterium]
MPKFRFAAFVAWILLLALPQWALAQSQPSGASDIVTQQRTAISSLSQRTDDAQKKIEIGQEDDNRLVEIRLLLEQVERDLIAASVAFRPRLAEINDRIQQLGPPPADGAAEPDVIAAERLSLSEEKAEINAALGVAENLSIRVNNLINQLTEMRRELFTRQLTKRYDIGSEMLGEVGAAVHSETQKLYYAVSSWLRFVIRFKLPSFLAATFFAVAAAALLLIGGRRAFGQYYTPDPAQLAPTYLSRLSVAFWSTFMRSAAMAVFLGVAYFFYDYFAVLRDDIREMLVPLLYVIGVVFFVYTLAVAVLSPRLPNWRLIPVETRAARRLVFLVLATAVFTGIDSFLTAVYRTLGSPLSLTVGESLIATVITGGLVILIGLIKPYADPAGRPIGWPRWLRAFLCIVGAVTVIAALLGYIGLARFLAQQIVITGAILATMYIGFLSARAVAEEGAFGRTAFGARIQRRFKVDETALDQIALVLSVAINVLVAVVGLPLILLQAGFKFGDIRAWVLKALEGFQVGSFTFSPAGILSGLVVFVVGYLLTRWFQGWLDGSVMARGRVDLGVRNSIRTVVGYAGIAVAVLLGISAAGLDLSSLALIAGGLSLGIGFGLQNIVSNFVSGLILLIERPFKSGDWIVAGDVSGTVKKISVRATEIETFQRQSVILPNSQLINAAVGNWTLKNRIGRVDIRVNVAYDSDATRAYELMVDIARAHPKALRNPEPFVQFVNFGPAALEFEIRITIADILEGGIVQNDVRFAVLDAFQKEGIAIPSTARAPDPERPPAWPADDEKAEAEHVAAVEQKQQRDAEAAKGRRKRKPDPS